MSHCLTVWEKRYCALEGTSGLVFLYPNTTSSSPASEIYFLSRTCSLCFYRAGAQGGSVTFWDCPLHPRRETSTTRQHSATSHQLLEIRCLFRELICPSNKARGKKIGLINNFSEDTPIRKLKIIIRLGTVLNKEWGKEGYGGRKIKPIFLKASLVLH